MRAPRVIEFGGERGTVRWWANRLGIKEKTLQDRLCKWSVEKSLTQPVIECRERVIEYAGKRMTVAEWARKLGLKQSTLQTRLKKGWHLERALVGRKQAKSNRENYQGRIEDCCLKCTVTPDCNPLDDRCEYPRGKDGGLVAYSSLMQDTCGF